MLAWFANVQQKFIRDFLVEDRWRYITKGLGVTIQVTLAALLIGVVIGIVVGIIRCAYDMQRPSARGFRAWKSWMKEYGVIRGFFLWLGNLICKLYITIIRGTPVLVQLLLMFFVILVAPVFTKKIVAIMTFGINSGAYVAEIIRGGILSVPKGQMEAGRSLGMGYVATMRKVILPQAFKHSLPSLINEMISLLKETSICGYIGLNELTRGGDIIRGITFDALLPLLVVAVIYLAIVLLIQTLMGVVEKKLRSSEVR